MSKANPEFDNFNNLLGRLLKVPHSAIKAKLDAEKKAKARRKTRKAKRASAGRDSGGED